MKLLLTVLTLLGCLGLATMPAVMAATGGPAALSGHQSDTPQQPGVDGDAAASEEDEEEEEEDEEPDCD